MTTATTMSSEPAITNSNSGWLEKLARWGYASRGIIYFVIGSLALMAAIGNGGSTTDSKGAIAKLMQAPGGWLLVLALCVGLLGYSAWRFCQAFFDADGHGTDGKAMVIRGGLMVSSVTHLFLAFWAGKLAIGSATSSGGSSGKETMVATLMSQPFGQWLVGIAGAILVGVGIAQFLKGHGEKFDKHFTWDYDERRWLVNFCKFGLYARGVIFAIIGSFVIYAAYTTDPNDAGGLEQALEWMRSQPFGPWLLGITAIGLICFAVYSCVEAIYRRVNTPT